MSREKKKQKIITGMRKDSAVCYICQTVPVIFNYDTKCIAIRNQK